MKGSKDKKDEEFKICSECGKTKRRNQFYTSNNTLFDGRSPICNICVRKSIDIDDIETVYSVLKLLDVPFIYDEWASTVETGGNVFGKYLRQVTALHQFKGMTWKDSQFNDQDDSEVDIDKDADTKISDDSSEKKQDMSELADKWGHGYSHEEYVQFERKYQTLKNHYPERTAMHTEALFTYIRYRVKEEIATAEGLAKEAKDWGALAKDAATAAKINPSQLTKADLSDGLDSFSQLTRSVEQAVDIVDILPRFKARPQDRADFTIWAYVNYIRDLKGLPLASYEEVYKFYEDRVKEYEISFGGDESGIL